jgi:5'-deoxynucleotidase YfbR-like HD superfamily hydrolase
MSLFPPELRTMAFVPRWCIVMTTLKDNIATHSFYVAVYSWSIAELIKWPGNREYLLMNALLHDNDECITGDITGPFKGLLVDEYAQDAIDIKTMERMGGLIQAYWKLEDTLDYKTIVQQVETIVKAADKLDAQIFLILNKSLGNNRCGPALEGGMRSLEGAWRALPASKDVLDETWNTMILPMLKEHETKGGRGAAPGVNI